MNRKVQERLWGAIASSIKNAIRRGELYPGARIASETDLAAQWNVSPMTVQRALGELQREGWVVRRPKIGTVVADRSMHPLSKVALIMTTLSEAPQSEYARGIKEGLGEGYRLLTYSSRNIAVAEADCLQKALAECDAVICYPTGDKDKDNVALMRRIASVMPLLFVDCMPDDDIDADLIATDHGGSLRMGLKYLQSQGHSRIAYFMGVQVYVSSVKERHAAYAEFIENDICADPKKWVRTFSYDTPLDQWFDNVTLALVELLRGPEPITSVACQQDDVMAAVLEACIHLGISVPTELAILSFNDFPVIAQPLGRTVHRLVQRASEIGHIAAQRTRLRIETPGLPVQHVRLLTDFYPATAYSPSAAAEGFIEDRLELLGKTAHGPRIDNH